MWVLLHPRPDEVVGGVEKADIMDVVALHHGPCAGNAVDAVLPELESLVGKFGPKSVSSCESIKTVAVFSKVGSQLLKGVHHLEGGWRGEAVEEKSGADFTQVKAFCVVGDNNIGLVEEGPQISGKKLVICKCALLSATGTDSETFWVVGVIGQGADVVGLLVVPPISD